MLIDLALTVPDAHSAWAHRRAISSPLYWRPGQSSSITVAATSYRHYYLLDGVTIRTRRSTP